MNRIMIFLLTVTLPSCMTYPCNKGFINPAFVGFSPGDIDTIILRAYKPNDNYLHLVDTIIVQNAGTNIYTTSNDTTVVYININSSTNTLVIPGFDWQIYIPAKNRTVMISNIITTPTKGGHQCRNPINSFTQDGQAIVPKYVQTNQFYTSGYMAYIQN